MKSIAEMSADEYRALIENPATNDNLDTPVMHIPTNTATNNELAQRRRLNDERAKSAKTSRAQIAQLDRIPEDRAPSGEELVQFDRDRERFLAEYSQFVQCPGNANVFLNYLRANNATPSYRNLVAAFNEKFDELQLRLEQSVEVVGEHGEQDSNRSLAENLATPKARRRGLPYVTTGVQSAPRFKKVVTRTLQPGEVKNLDTATYDRLTKPMPKVTHASFEDQRVQQLSADAFKAEFIPTDIPLLVRARIDKAVDEFCSACPDFDKSDPTNAEIVKMYLVKHDLPWDSSMSYIQAWRHFRAIPEMEKHLPELVINESKSGSTTVKTNPSHQGFDPIAEFVIDKALRRKLDAMSGIEYNEYLAKHPEVRAAIDRT